MICPECGYRSNMEAAPNKVVNEGGLEMGELEKVYTPHCKTIEEVVDFLGVPVEYSCKAVMYQKNSNDEYVIVFLRGDYEVNETKLTNYLGEKVHPAEITEESGIAAGFTGPYQLKADCQVIYDSS